MKHLDEATYILGIKTYTDRSRYVIGIRQSTYVNNVLKRFRMDNSKKGLLPISHGAVLCKIQTSDVPFASAIGSIMYAMICTRPGVSFAPSVCHKYQSNPRMIHWETVKLF